MVLLLLIPAPAWVRDAGLGVALAALVAVLLLLLLARGRRLLLSWLLRFGDWAAGAGEAALDVAAVWLQPGRLWGLVTWTLAVWAIGALVNLLVLAAFGIPGGLGTAFVLLVLLQMGARVPGVPANIGVFEFLCQVGLGWFGIEPNLALSYGLALHVIVLLPALIVGGLLLWRDSALLALLQRGGEA